MKLLEAIEIAELTMIDAEAHGFDATAQAMRNVLTEMLIIHRGTETTTDRPGESLPELAVWN